MKRYECVKGFNIDKVDGDGFTVEEGGIVIKVGSVWVDQDQEYRLVGGEVRLEAEDESLWIEIPSDMIPAFFKEV